MARKALAIDVGGTKVAAAVVTEDGEVLRRSSVPTRGDTLFADLVAMAGEVRGGDEVVCGVGCGGPMTWAGGSGRRSSATASTRDQAPSGVWSRRRSSATASTRDQAPSGVWSGELVSPLNIPAWRGFPLRSRLADALGLPTFVDNDAKALALGEGWVGGARGVRDFLAMVVSTGVGGGIVLDGRLLDGADGNAGHIGHVVVEPSGRRCGCGAYGCLEAEASGTAIAAFTGRPPAEADEGVRTRTGMLVGRAVASVANLLDLRLALVAGSVALGFGDAFFVAAQEEVDRSARLSFSRGCVVRPAALGDAGPLVGAAAVGWRGLNGR